MHKIQCRIIRLKEKWYTLDNSLELKTSHIMMECRHISVFKGTSRGLKVLQSYMNNSYHKSALYWPEPTINPWTSRAMVRIIFG